MRKMNGKISLACLRIEDLQCKVVVREWQDRPIAVRKTRASHGITALKGLTMTKEQMLSRRRVTIIAILIPSVANDDNNEGSDNDSLPVNLMVKNTLIWIRKCQMAVHISGITTRGRCMVHILSMLGP